MKHVMFEDINNFYGCAMLKPFATGEFELTDIEKFDMNKYSDSIPKGCVLENDLEYPNELDIWDEIS